MSRCVCLFAAVLWFACAGPVEARPDTRSGDSAVSSPAEQPPAGELPAATVCGTSARPAAQPPAGSGPVVLFIAPCFEAQGNQSLIEAQTYLYYIQLKQSRPSEGVWVPYTDESE